MRVDVRTVNTRINLSVAFLLVLFPTLETQRRMSTSSGIVWVDKSWLYDWSMAFKATNHKYITLVQLNNPKSRCVESLYPFLSQFLELGFTYLRSSLPVLRSKRR